MLWVYEPSSIGNAEERSQKYLFPLPSLKQQGSNNSFSAVSLLNKNISFTLHISVVSWCLLPLLCSVLFFRPQPWITRGYWDKKELDMIFYKFIFDSFSTSQFVFHKGRQCRAGRQKMVCNWILSLQSHWLPVLILEGLSTPNIAVPICMSSQLLQCQHCNNGAFRSSAT